MSFLQGNDTFVSLPTGYGKSLIYALLPYTFDMIRSKHLLIYLYYYYKEDSLLDNIKFRNMLLSAPYKKNLVALVVDEAHCVKTWGDTFRMAFAEIGTLRSLISPNVRIMALTATCTLK